MAKIPGILAISAVLTLGAAAIDRQHVDPVTAHHTNDMAAVRAAAIGRQHVDPVTAHQTKGMAAVDADHGSAYVTPPATHLPRAPYAPWAHSHMVWLSSDRSNQSAVLEYVAEYAQHNITVGGLDIDSEWSTGNNNFIVDTTKFPDLGSLVDTMHKQNINVILWMTSMIDTDSSNFQEAYNNSYFIKNGFNESALVKWWHGTGGFLDYGNPDAKAWWESQLDNVLKLGIDGWKSDGTDPYIIEILTPISKAGYITFQDYSTWYYGHSFNYTRQVNGDHCLIWSRPVDSYPLILNLSAFLEFSPKYVMASGWVGDQDPTFEGMKMALINILESAWRGYANYGSDTGGYRSGSRTGELLLRWAQLNAFLPLFENGGDDEHRPWMYDAPGSTFFVDAYRSLVAAHYEIGPYLLQIGTIAILSGTSVLTPQSAPPADFPFIVQPDMLTNYAYLLGPNFFISPIVDANVTYTSVSIPGNASDTWYEYWAPSKIHYANRTFVISCPLNSSAVFVKTGAIVPLHVSTPLGTIKDADDTYAGALSLVVHTPVADAVRSSDIHDWETTGLVAQYHFDAAQRKLTLASTSNERDLIWIIRNIELSSDARVYALGVNGSSSSTLFAAACNHPSTYAAQKPAAPYYHRQGHQAVRASAPQAASDLELTYCYRQASESASGIPELTLRLGSGVMGPEVVIEGVQVISI